MHSPAAEHVLIRHVNLVKHVTPRNEKPVHRVESQIDLVDVVYDSSRDNKVERFGFQYSVRLFHAMTINVLQFLRVWLNAIVEVNAFIKGLTLRRRQPLPKGFVDTSFLLGIPL